MQKMKKQNPSPPALCPFPSPFTITLNIAPTLKYINLIQNR
jgi:hypothetical protein